MRTRCGQKLRRSRQRWGRREVVSRVCAQVGGGLRELANEEWGACCSAVAPYRGRAHGGWESVAAVVHASVSLYWRGCGGGVGTDDNPGHSCRCEWGG